MRHVVCHQITLPQICLNVMGCGQHAAVFKTGAAFIVKIDIKVLLLSTLGVRQAVRPCLQDRGSVPGIVPKLMDHDLE